MSCILTSIGICLALTLFKKSRLSCHNLFLLDTRKPTTYLTLQEDHKISIYCHFFSVGLVGPNVEISSKSPLKGWPFQLVFTKILLTIWHFQNGLIEYKKFQITELIWTFLILGKQVQI